MKQANHPERPEGKKPPKEINTYINEFGQIVRDVPVEEINDFLNEHVPDKKLEEGNEAIIE